VSTQAFDTLAADYDATFTDTPLGGLLRAVTWTRIDAAFPPGSQILEVGCGTGADAVHLGRRGVRVTATDSAPAMVAATRAKADATGLTDAVRTMVFDVGYDVPAALLTGEPFDGVLANFGSLNCVADLAGTSRRLAGVVRPGGTGIVVVMGRVVPWEWAWYLVLGQPTKAVRRFRQSTPWRGMSIRYPTIGDFRRAWADDWTVVKVQAVGIALPPSYAERWTRRRPRLLNRLHRLEQRIATWPGAAHLADHYLVELVRR
jgi:SAM-dependent methyltransferase